MFTLLLNLSVILMQFSAVFAMRVTSLGEDPETKKMTKLFTVPSSVFFGLFGLNVFLYLVFYLFTQFSLGSAVFYFALVVIGRITWLARKAGDNSIETMHGMRPLKRTIVMALFLYAMFWLSRGLFAVG